MTKTIIGLIILFSVSCSSQDFEKGYVNKDAKSKWKNIDGVNRSLEWLWNDVKMLQIKKEQNPIEIAKPLNKRVSAFIVGSLGEIKLVDDIYILFFLKMYKAQLEGNKNLSNASCCLSSSPILAQFTYHFYKKSNLDPTIGLMLEDIFNWITLNTEKNTTPEIVDIITKINLLKE